MHMNMTCDNIFAYHPSVAETKPFQDRQVIIMAADALAPWITGSSAAMEIDYTRQTIPCKDFNTPVSYLGQEKMPRA